MAKLTYSSNIGVSEAIAKTLNKAKTIIGTVDDNGDNIGIVDIQLRVFHKLPTLIMLIFFIPVLCGYFFQTPLSWLPVQEHQEWLWAAKNFQIFTLWSWIFAVLAYVFLAFCVLLKNNLYSGVEGAYIIFQRHGEIVKILNPGNFWINFDWRIAPEYVVSSKKFMLTMPQVKGKERSNHTMYHTGALVGQITNAEDAHKLIAKGGFKNLLKAVKAMYITSVKDMFKGTTADTFNTFLVEPIKGAADLKDDSRDLDQISKQNLSTELIRNLARIDNVDVSAIDLSEEGGIRDTLLPMLQNVAAEYGVHLEDYIPLGNSVSNDFLSTKVIKLVTILERLKQASDNLYDIIAEEWDEDIQSAVAGKKVGALEIKKIIDEMESLMTTMMDDDNISNIFEEKFETINNIMKGHIGTVLTQIKTLQDKITSKTVDMTGLELYVAETEILVNSLMDEKSIKALGPVVNTVWVSGMDKESLVPNVDTVDNMLKVTGLKTNIEKFKSGALDDKSHDFESIQGEVDAISKEVESIEIEGVLEDLQGKMDAVTGDAGIDISGHKWPKVKVRINNIKEDAGVDDDDEEVAE